jgi:hypothetical protein
MSAVETADILEENQMLAVTAVKGFHVAPRLLSIAKREAQLGLALASRAPEATAFRPVEELFRQPTVSLATAIFGHTQLMPTIEGATVETLTQYRAGVTATPESSVSAVTWPAIFGGAFVAAASSIVLVALGSGLGLASVSPWRDSGVSATGFAWMTAVWFIVVQWLSSGVGGYLAGRLRTKWVNTHTHEVFFRDTAHGFITWAVATVIVAGFLASAIGSAISGGVHAAATVGAGAAAGAGGAAASDGAATRSSANQGGGATAMGTGVASATGTGGTSSVQQASALASYDMDLLFRSTQTTPSTSTADARAEAARILANGVETGDVPSTDRAYLAELVAARTGVSTDEAQKRVDNAIAQAKAADVKARAAADKARKTAAETSIFTALSMLVGAFIACIAAALGGQRRDLHA